MGFQFTEQHIEDFYTRGITIFRGIMPPALITDLRRVTDEGREIARARHGQQAQRLQPLNEFDIDHKPFEDYRDLPPLRDAVERILGPGFSYGDFDWLGVLLEPSEMPYCMAWHRDAREFLNDEEWETYTKDPRYGNQVNAPIYEDSCTWIVPGSHIRPDLPREMRFGLVDGRQPTPNLEGKSYAERERLCNDYCQSMPGAVQLHLNAGDFALYKPWAWHLGSYLPYRKRATLHDSIYNEKSRDWISFLRKKQRGS